MPDAVDAARTALQACLGSDPRIPSATTSSSTAEPQRRQREECAGPKRIREIDAAEACELARAARGLFPEPRERACAVGEIGSSWLVCEPAREWFQHFNSRGHHRCARHRAWRGGFPPHAALSLGPAISLSHSLGRPAPSIQSCCRTGHRRTAACILRAVRRSALSVQPSPAYLRDVPSRPR